MDSERVHRLVNYVRELGKQFSFGTRLKFVVHIGMGTEGRTHNIVAEIIERAKQTPNFNKNKFIVRTTDGKGFEEVQTIREYRLVIMHPELY